MPVLFTCAKMLVRYSSLRIFLLNAMYLTQLIKPNENDKEIDLTDQKLLTQFVGLISNISPVMI